MITTFDNKQWTKQEILDNMYDDSFYYGYLGQNALSSSSIKTLISSPKTYYFTTKYGSGETQALRDGRLFHTMILEPEKLNDIVFVEAATKASKEYKLAKESGKEVYTNTEKKAAERLTDALLRNEAVKEYLINAYRAGASGYLVKDCDRDELYFAIKKVAKGGRYFGDSITNSMMDRLIESNNEPQKRFNNLTRRELEILHLLIEGYSTKQIAEKLFISFRTVDKHRSNMMEKIEVHNVVDLINYVRENRLIQE
jgi:DNA-binding NarL/FixJ family response regulator